ncbi:MAG: hypothetical protein LBP28_05210 [Coriobacteriales bacterium]|nr:hypothetical protein [Coriobacteriales bacterium]
MDAAADVLVNRQAEAIAAYLRGGFEIPCGQCLGFELEHFIVERDTHRPVFYHYPDHPGRIGVADILAELAGAYDEALWEEDAEGKRSLVGLQREQAVLTLEPGAQLEISIGPATTIPEIEAIYTAFYDELAPILEREGLELSYAGYHPQALARDIPLIPKDRYRYMDKHFAQSGRHGICMMRATASCQVSLDFASEEDAVRKMRVALGLGPLLSFLCDNARVFEGCSVFDAALDPGLVAASGLEVPTGMVRAAIWNDVDARRSLLPAGSFAADFGFRAYAEALLRSPAIFLPPSLTGAGATWADGASFSTAYAGRELSDADIEHILSLFFFDTRFKRYLEIRPADSMPPRYALAYTALLKGLFYQTEALAELGRRFAGLDDTAVAQATVNLRHDGYDADVYGRSAGRWLEGLLVMAGYGLDEDEVDYLDPLGDLVAERKTLLDVPPPALVSHRT